MSVRIASALISAALFASISSASAEPRKPAARGGPAAFAQLARTLAPDDAILPATGVINIPRYQRKGLVAYVEYNTGTCKEISEGKWTLARKPKWGVPAFATVKGTIGACPGVTFSAAAIYYTWKTHSNESVEDLIDGHWTTPDKQFDVAWSSFVEVPVVRPASETTVAAGWDSKGLGLWRQTLHPPADDPKFDFSYDEVRESDPGHGGPDTCWFKGSAISPFTSITGGTWFPDEKGVWEFDHVGWFTTSVAYYRAHRRAPCGTTFPQQMQHDSPAKPGWVDYGKVNKLGGTFTKTQVTSIRAGSTETR
jgi:hypothetical protein